MLFVELMQRMSLVAMAAYVFTRIKTFNSFFQNGISYRDKISIVIFFSFLAIMGNYLGIPIIDNALVNTRPIGVITAGYIGGPAIGALVGFIAGLHRYTLGGVTALACALASVAEGLIGSFFARKLKTGDFKIRQAICASIFAELTQYLIILIVGKPFNIAVEVVKVIFIPMLFVNTVGVAIFVAIIKESKIYLQNYKAEETLKTLRIAKKATYHMKLGFTKENIEKFINEIQGVANVIGVFFVNEKNTIIMNNINVEKEKILKWCSTIGNYSNDHIQLHYEYKDKLREYPIFINTVKVNNKCRGYFGIKVKSQYDIKNCFDLCEELSSILSNELEIYELNKLAKQGVEANYRALIQQIHPHFLFNSLTTIASLCRTNPEKARFLILELSNYFRTTLKRKEDFASLEKELEFLTSYLNIEKARFGERLSININVEDELLTIMVPVFILQPLIENAIKHGILPKIKGGKVDLTIREEENYYVFIVEDDGVGIDEERLKNIMFSENSGIGIRNVNERLKLLYGEESGLDIRSKCDEGTTVLFKIPKELI